MGMLSTEQQTTGALKCAAVDPRTFTAFDERSASRFGQLQPQNRTCNMLRQTQSVSVEQSRGARGRDESGRVSAVAHQWLD
jgi:hypothetical protein